MSLWKVEIKALSDCDRGKMNGFSDGAWSLPCAPTSAIFFYAVNHMPDAGQGRRFLCVKNGTAAAITAANKNLRKTVAPAV